MNALTSTTTTAEPAMLGFLERAVTDPSFDVNKFEVVLKAMQAERAKQAERAFYGAMAVAQGEMEPVRKDATNPSTRSKYARFEAIDAVVRPVYTRHGFSVSYRTGTPSRPGSVRVICTVAHAAGHSVEAELEAALDGSGAQGRSNKTDVQATGSTVSYLRRYILTMVWNIALASDDDDGEAGRGQPQQQARPQRQHAGPDRRAEMDRTLRGDDIPEDRLLKIAKRFGERMAEVRAKLESEGVEAAQEQLNGIMGNEGLRAEWNKIRIERPDLDQEMRDEASDTLKLIVAEAGMGGAGEP